jgi:hypothetical protein
VIIGDFVVDEIVFAVSVFDEDSEVVGVESGNTSSTSINFSSMMARLELIAFLVSHGPRQRIEKFRCFSKNDDGDDDEILMLTTNRDFWPVPAECCFPIALPLSFQPFDSLSIAITQLAVITFKALA